MQKDVVIPGYTLTATPTPSTLVATLTPTNTTALRCTAASQSLLVSGLAVHCECTGTVPGGNFTGKGDGTITASTPRVTCEGESIIAQDDSVTIACSGDITSGASTSTGTFNVKVSIAAAGQTTVNANKV
jgi:hypothetical protein